MKYLLDTATLLWFAFDNQDKFSKRVLEILVKSEDELLLSAISTWEIVIKYSIKKLNLEISPEKLISEATTKMNLNHLPVTSRHALQAVNLPFHHKDPFDRLLVAQAQAEGLSILSPDVEMKKYDVEVIW